MIKRILSLFFGIFLYSCSIKPPTVVQQTAPVLQEEKIPEKEVFRASYTKNFDLTHTRLNVAFNWKKKQLIGEASIILHPHFYSTDSLLLNARGMDLIEVALLSSKNSKLPLPFTYDSLIIHIKLDRAYTREESLTIFIRYISKPDDLPEGGSFTIKNDKGLYFINADSLDAEYPTQVWTQGETESNSVWFPTIEDPGQKMTQEIYMTIDTAFTTMSNGLLISSVNNSDGTKTDYWKQSLPASPYLTMIAVGKFAVVKDSWKNIDVNYYVDPPFEKYAKMVFGKTPEMMSFFSDKLGVQFPWEKYSQIVVHDYISGAMENTTAVIHGTNMQQDPGDYMDGNFENYISHELFHHWFGDLVTCESWSNIALNESFANYSEYLWREYKYSRDDADRLSQADLGIYLYTAAKKDPPLFRSKYNFREDVYDAISYDKGGRILHMLRKYVGDEAFFASLNDYLTAHRFGTAEIDDLRMSFEKITGEDLNWFFNQWFMKGGHPVINIDYNWNDSLHRETITIKQIQKFSSNPLYKLPLEVDFYYDGKVRREKIVVEDAIQKFQFDLPMKPNLVNADAEKMLVCTKTENKTTQEYIFQYDHAPLYLDRFEALAKVGVSYTINTPEADLVMRALHDKYSVIRQNALNFISELALNKPDTVKQVIFSMAKSDSSADVREKALTVIGKYYSYSDNILFINDALKDTSYKVKARAFKIISDKDIERAKAMAPDLERDSGQAILAKLSEFYSTTTEDKTTFYRKAIRLGGLYTRYQIIGDFGKYLKNSTDTTIILKGADILVERAKRPASKNYRSSCLNTLKDVQRSFKKRLADETGEETPEKEKSQTPEKIALIQKLTFLSKTLENKISAIDK